MAEGSCLCGACRYRAEGTFSLMTHCHCGRCRKHHGSAFSTMVAAPSDGFSWQAGAEHVRAYRSSETFDRWFCELCGS